MENFRRCTKETFRNAHWDGKRARLGEIKILTYIRKLVKWYSYYGFDMWSTS